MVQMSNLLPIFTNASEGPRVGFWLDKLLAQVSDRTQGLGNEWKYMFHPLSGSFFWRFWWKFFLKQHWKQRKKRRMIKPTSIWNMIFGEFLNHTLMLLLRRLVFFCWFCFFDDKLDSSRWILFRRQGGYAKTGDPVRWPKGLKIPIGAMSTDLRLVLVCWICFLGGGFKHFFNFHVQTLRIFCFQFDDDIFQMAWFNRQRVFLLRIFGHYLHDISSNLTRLFR